MECRLSQERGGQNKKEQTAEIQGKSRTPLLEIQSLVGLLDLACSIVVP